MDFHCLISIKFLVVFVDVILPLAVPKCYTYIAPDSLLGVRQGSLVRVTLGRKFYNGIVLRLHDDAEEGINYKPVLGVLSKEPIVSSAQIELWQWVARYYMCKMGDVLKAAIPTALFNDAYKSRTFMAVRLKDGYEHKPTPKQKILIDYIEREAESGAISLSSAVEAASAAVVNLLEKKGVIEKYQAERSRFSYSEPVVAENPLTEAQQKAYDETMALFAEHKPVLLKGVTSSGKTEIYIKLIKNTIAQGRQVLYLVPEIALTTQLKQRLQRVFGDALFVYHSKLNDQERAEVYNEAISGERCMVVLGVRSSVFLSFKDLGLVIVDEQHDQSYKQQEPAPRYHAGNTAVVLARLAGADVIMGSATPSVEAYYNATSGRWGLVELGSRYGGVLPPELTVVDMLAERRKNKVCEMFSWVLRDKIAAALEHGEQVILFHNRRGHSTSVCCPSCGWVPQCDSCSVPLTYHKVGELLSCHYCGHKEPMPLFCPVCGNDLDTRGYGTERVEEVLHGMFPDAGVLRLDLDSASGKNSYERILGDFAAGKAKILIGTQMVSKGLDFSNVSLVGILNADTLIDYPDFRSSEQSFQTLLQVSGRCGRRSRRGEVVMQTSHATYPIVQQVADSDYRAFFDEQIAVRSLLAYPPFSRLVFLYVKGKNPRAVNGSSQMLTSMLGKQFPNYVLGPGTPPVAKISDYHIRRVVVKILPSLSLADSKAFIYSAIEETLRNYGSISIYADIDPV